MADRLKRLSDDEPDRGASDRPAGAPRYTRASEVRGEAATEDTTRDRDAAPDPDARATRDRDAAADPDARATRERDLERRPGDDTTATVNDGGGSNDGFRDLIDGWIGRNRATSRSDRTPAQRDTREHGRRGGDNAVAVVALVLGVASVGGLLLSAGWLFFLSLPLGIVAVVLGIRGKRRVDHGASRQHRGPAKAAIALGATAVVLSLVALALLIAGVAVVGEGLGVLSNEADRQKQEQSQSGDAAARRAQQQREELKRRSAQQREELARRAAAQREELRRRTAERRSQ